MALKRYSDDYELVITQDEKGDEKKVAVYKGKYYKISVDEMGLKQFRRNCLVLLLATLVLHTGGGFVGNRGMYQFYVALPYVFAFFPLIYLAAGVFRLPKEKRNYRRDEIGISFERMKVAVRVLMVLLGIGVVGEILFILIGPEFDSNMLEYFYLVLEGLTFLAGYLLFKVQGSIRVQTCDDLHK